MAAPLDNIAVLPGSAEPNDEHHRIPPHNYEAEAALLGAILANNQAYEKVSDFLRAEHFAEPAHGRIFAAIVKLIDRGQIADSVQLAHFFNDDEALKEVGGAAYLAELQSSIVSIINAADYGKTIHDLHLRRELISLGEEIVNEAFTLEIDNPALGQIEVAESQLFSLAEHGETESGIRKFSAVLSETMLIAQEAHKRDGQMVGLSTGLHDLDHLLGGLHRSDLLIIAARPAMGKTTLATNIAFNAARQSGAVVAFFSLEMSGEQLTTRMLSEQAAVPSEKIRRGELSNDEFQRVVTASRDLEDITYFIDDTPSLPVSTLRTRARRLKRQSGKLDLILVDYLQLMRGTVGGRGSENRVQEISDITRGLKGIAKELDVPVIALSQLSRQVENREDKRPQLADLRESGSIEQDADSVMFIYREEYYLQKAEPMQKPEESDIKFQERYAEWQARCEEVYGLAKVIVAKQRHGPTGDVTLTFDGATTRFASYKPTDQLPEQTY
jgi:replicative DNA helicase